VSIWNVPWPCQRMRVDIWDPPANFRFWIQDRNRKSKIENPKSDHRLVAYIAADEEPQSLEDLLH
jgi:hypothetical protein